MTYNHQDLALLGGQPITTQQEFPRDRTSVTEEVKRALLQTLISGSWSMFTSEEVAIFEEEFSAYTGAKHAVLVNSCTTAIHASLLASGITSHSRVAVPEYTYVGTCLPVAAVGASPVFIDIDSDTQSISPDALKAEFEKGPIDAVIQAHLFGKPGNINAIFELCKRYGATYIGDCAQLLGNKQLTSKISKEGVCCFSFGESKVLRIGEGGAVTTDSYEIAEKIRLARHEGELWLGHNRSRVEGWMPTPKNVINDLASVQIGLNYRPTAFIATLGRAKLKELDDVLSRTDDNASYLFKKLSHLSKLTLPNPKERIWWTYPLVINDTQIDRDVLLAALLAEGIPVGVHFPRLMSEHPILKSIGANSLDPFPNAEFFSENHLVLPIYPNLSSEHMELISTAICKVLECYTPDIKLEAQRYLATRQLSELCSGLFMFLEPSENGKRQ